MRRRRGEAVGRRELGVGEIWMDEYGRFSWKENAACEDDDRDKLRI
jgi:hypothetical protein